MPVSFFYPYSARIATKMIVPVGLVIAGRTVVLERQELAGHADLDAVALRIRQRCGLRSGFGIV
jgi:hypothetical protein